MSNAVRWSYPSNRNVEIDIKIQFYFLKLLHVMMKM